MRLSRMLAELRWPKESAARILNRRLWERGHHLLLEPNAGQIPDDAEHHDCDKRQPRPIFPTK